jgi:hypothetical protein
VRFEVELFRPGASRNLDAPLEPLGPCKIITRPVFLTVTEASGDARLVDLDDVVEVDRTQARYTTALGKAHQVRRIELPDRIYVEAASGYARALSGDQIARLSRARGDAPGKGVRW